MIKPDNSYSAFNSADACQRRSTAVRRSYAHAGPAVPQSLRLTAARGVVRSHLRRHRMADRCGEAPLRRGPLLPNRASPWQGTAPDRTLRS